MPRIDRDDLYWRCVVFNIYSSGAWVRTPLPRDERGMAAPGARIGQTLFVEPLETIDLNNDASVAALATFDLDWRISVACLLNVIGVVLAWWWRPWT